MLGFQRLAEGWTASPGDVVLSVPRRIVFIGECLLHLSILGQAGTTSIILVHNNSVLASRGVLLALIFLFFDLEWIHR